MTENEVLGLLGSVTVGTVIAWILALTACGVALVKVGRKAYSIVNRVKGVLDTNDAQNAEIAEIKCQYSALFEDMEYFKMMFKRLEEDRLAEYRHEIVKSGEQYINRGYISVREFRALCEMFERYKSPGSDGVVHNGYVSSLMDIVKKLPVKGKLDEHGKDIPDDNIGDQESIM